MYAATRAAAMIMAVHDMIYSTHVASYTCNSSVATWYTQAGLCTHYHGETYDV